VAGHQFAGRLEANHLEFAPAAAGQPVADPVVALARAGCVGTAVPVASQPVAEHPEAGPAAGWLVGPEVDPVGLAVGRAGHLARVECAGTSSGPVDRVAGLADRAADPVGPVVHSVRVECAGTFAGPVGWAADPADRAAVLAAVRPARAGCAEAFVRAADLAGRAAVPAAVRPARVGGAEAFVRAADRLADLAAGHRAADRRAAPAECSSAPAVVPEPAGPALAALASAPAAGLLSFFVSGLRCSEAPGRE
jgi:hypothetical protein